MSPFKMSAMSAAFANRTLKDTHHREKLFHSIQYKNGCLHASDLFHMFTQSVKFYTFHYILKSTGV